MIGWKGVQGVGYFEQSNQQIINSIIFFYCFMFIVVFLWIKEKNEQFLLIKSF
jgi:hypothetical protein